MKSLLKYSIHPIYGIFIAIMLFFSCKKTENNTNFNKQDVHFYVSSIISAEANDKSQIANNIAAVKSQFAEKPIVEDFENFSWELSTSSEDNKSTLNHSYIDNQDQILLKASATNYAATTPMALGVKYMLLIYKIINGSESHIGSYPVSVGSSDFKVTLPKNSGQYAYYAYSYNNSEDLSSSIPSNLDNPVIPNKTDAPLLFAKGTFNLANNTDARVSMTFKHQISKIEVKIDGLQVFANSITNLNVDINNTELTTHNYSLKNQTQTGTTPISRQTLTNLPLTFVSGMYNNISTNAIKISTNKIYTSTINPEINLVVKALVINKSGTTLTLNTDATPKAAPFPSSSFTDNGKLIKQAVITIKPTTPDTGPYEWGMGNLYYDDSDPVNKYKIGEARTGGGDAADPCNYYWNWNTLYPRSDARGLDRTYEGDPCSKVLPENTWRTPTVTDFEYIVSFNLVSVSNSVLYLPLPGGQNLYFWDNGTITGTSTSNACDVGNIDDGQYWSSTSASNSRAIILYMDGGPTPWIKVASSPGGTNYYDRSKDQGRPIRCVKDR